MRLVERDVPEPADQNGRLYRYARHEAAVSAASTAHDRGDRGVPRPSRPLPFFIHGRRPGVRGELPEQPVGRTHLRRFSGGKEALRFRAILE